MESPDRVPYATPKDFDRALTDRNAFAGTTLPYSVAQLRSRFAYGRLPTRVFLHAPERWVLERAACLLARIPGQTCYSMDIDTIEAT